MKEVKQRSLDPGRSGGFMKRLMGDIVEVDVRARRLPVPMDAGPAEKAYTTPPAMWLKDFQDRAERDGRLDGFVDRFDAQCAKDRADGVPVSLSDEGRDRIAACYASILVPRTSPYGLDKCAEAQVKDRMSDLRAFTQDEGGLRGLMSTYPDDDAALRDTPLPYTVGMLAALWRAEQDARKRGDPVLCRVGSVDEAGGLNLNDLVEFRTVGLLERYVYDTVSADTDLSRLSFDMTDAMPAEDRAECEGLVSYRGDPFLSHADWATRGKLFLKGMEDAKGDALSRNTFLAVEADKGVRPCEKWIPTPDETMRHQREMAPFLDRCEGVVGRFGPDAPGLLDPLRTDRPYIPTYHMAGSVRSKVETCVCGMYPGLDGVDLMSDLELVRETSRTAGELDTAYEAELAAEGRPVAKAMMPNTGDTLTFRTQAFLDAYLSSSVYGPEKDRKTRLSVQENLDAMEDDIRKKHDERCRALDEDPRFQLPEPKVGPDVDVSL